MNKIILFLLALQLCACASGPTPLKDREPKKELGFSFTPPQTDGWFEGKPPKGLKGFAYGKKIAGVDSKKHSVAFSVRYGTISTGLTKPQEILNFIKIQKENQLQGLRLDVKKDHSRFVTFKGAQCLEFDSMARDKYLNQNTTLTGLFCVHPDDHRRYIDISYSQRHDLSRPEIDIRSEGDQFVRGVSFLPIFKKSQASR